MAVLDILTDDNPRLREISQPVEDPASVQQLALDMIDTMNSRRGLGLAAIQVGQPVRLIVLNIDGVPLALINPVVVRKLNRDAIEREGCLSIPPSKWKRIARPAKCEVEATSLDGKRSIIGFKNWAARAALHEIDHLDGILLTDLPTAK